MKKEKQMAQTRKASSPSPHGQLNKYQSNRVMPSPSPPIMDKKKTEPFGDNVWCQVRGGLWDFCTQCAYGDRYGKLLELLEGGHK